MSKLEENTKLFYTELNNDCDINKLLEIAKKGILLYEPLYKYEKIKNHEYIIDISLLGNQLILINTIEQYNRFKNYTINPNNLNRPLYNSFHFENISCYMTIIVNKFFIEQLINEENDLFINKLLCNSNNSNFYLLKQRTKWPLKMICFNFQWPFSTLFWI